MKPGIAVVAAERSSETDTLRSSRFRPTFEKRAGFTKSRRLQAEMGIAKELDIISYEIQTNFGG